jgi:purine nucleosidase
VLRHGIAHSDFNRWLEGGGDVAQFYDAISRHTRDRSESGSRTDLYLADALAMAAVLEPEGVLEAQSRPLAIETQGQLTRGATIVDWERRSGAADNARIVMSYDRARFDALLRRALDLAN